MAQIALKRSLSLPLITFYGLGTILGAGIYVLIGKVAGAAGMYAPISFGLAAVIAGFTAFSYAELSARYPRSAGEAVYVQEAFHTFWLSASVGWAVVATGIISTATMANGFVGYLLLYIEPADWLIISVFVISLGILAAWGISESAWVATIITILEVVGLCMVLIIAGDNLAQLPARWNELVPPFSGEALARHLSGLVSSLLRIYWLRRHGQRCRGSQGANANHASGDLSWRLLWRLFCISWWQ